jgi:hypothetical protein
VPSTRGAYIEDLDIKLDSDVSINQAGKHENYKFKDGLVSFKIKELNPGVTVRSYLPFRAIIPRILNIT